jgi:hypothetical protein
VCAPKFHLRLILFNRPSPAAMLTFVGVSIPRRYFWVRLVVFIQYEYLELIFEVSGAKFDTYR